MCSSAQMSLRRFTSSRHQVKPRLTLLLLLLSWRCLTMESTSSMNKGNDVRTVKKALRGCVLWLVFTLMQTLNRLQGKSADQFGTRQGAEVFTHSCGWYLILLNLNIPERFFSFVACLPVFAFTLSYLVLFSILAGSISKSIQLFGLLFFFVAMAKLRVL